MTRLDTVICPTCSNRFDGEQALTFLGFRRYRCASCASKVIYPLKPSMRALYWVCIVIVCVEAGRILLLGQLPIPGILAIVFAGALLWDLHIRRRVRRLESSAVRQEGSRT